MKKKILFPVLFLLLCFCLLLSGCDAGQAEEATKGQITTGGTTKDYTEEQPTGTAPNEPTTEGQTTGTEPKPNEPTTETQTTGGDQTVEEPKNQNQWTYKTDANGVVVRELTIKAKKSGTPLEIVQLTDIHFNYCNEEDLKDAVLKSTYENRKWLRIDPAKNKNGSLTNALRCLEYAEGADQLVVTGDIYDYLSQGVIELAKEHIFDRFPNVIACAGNHEAIRQMQGTVEDTTSWEYRMELLKNSWPHDVDYYSKVLDERVMLIQMNNASDSTLKYGCFWDHQLEKLQKDLELAREKDYTVLLFYHIPLATGDPAYFETTALLVGDTNNTTVNFYTGGIGNHSQGTSKAVYNLIANNADIIAGAFCGHKHCDFYTEIKAKNADGSAAVIPQYVLNGVAYGKGHVLKITVE